MPWLSESIAHYWVRYQGVLGTEWDIKSFVH